MEVLQVLQPASNREILCEQRATEVLHGCNGVLRLRDDGPTGRRDHGSCRFGREGAEALGLGTTKGYERHQGGCYLLLKVEGGMEAAAFAHGRFCSRQVNRWVQRHGLAPSLVWEASRLI
jgi:hypothetical protein